MIKLQKGTIFHVTDEMLTQLQPSHNSESFPTALPMVLILDQARRNLHDLQIAMVPTKQKTRGIHLFMPKVVSWDTMIITEVEWPNATAMEFFDYLRSMIK